jgi:hypothetical protein
VIFLFRDALFHFLYWFCIILLNFCSFENKKENIHSFVFLHTDTHTILPWFIACNNVHKHLSFLILLLIPISISINFFCVSQIHKLPIFQVH